MKRLAIRTPTITTYETKNHVVALLVLRTIGTWRRQNHVSGFGFVRGNGYQV